jgi:hypothetical protein
MVTQLLYGESMTILHEKDNWTMIRCEHDGYEGWVSGKQLTAESNPPDVIGMARTTVIQMNDVLIPIGAFIRDSKYLLEAPVRTIEQYARLFLGTPYLWGGRTAMGIDCSGFTQIILRLVGVNLPRDAWQQALEGQEVSFIEECRTGDLAFFDNTEGRIIHVGIVLRPDGTFPPTIIHASGKVRIDALDHQGIFNKESGSYSHNLRMIRRYPIAQ